MKVTVSEIKKLTPEIVRAAEMAVNVQQEGSACREHLNLLTQEMATKVGLESLLYRAIPAQVYSGVRTGLTPVLVRRHDSCRVELYTRSNMRINCSQPAGQPRGCITNCH